MSEYRTGPVAVVAASGHTGRFVLDELARRGRRAIPVVRDPSRLAIGGAHEAPRAVEIGDAASLDAALAGAAAVINCAGPFVDTAGPVIDAALRAGIPYLDVAAEQSVVRSLFDTRDAAARAAAAPILPAAAFYGGLADLLASAVAGGAGEVDSIMVAVGLDSWHPTPGTRVTGQRNTAPRVIQRDGRLDVLDTPPPTGRWDFPEPIGRRDVVMLPFSEIITLASHLRADTVESWMNVEPLKELRDSATPPPRPSDASGRSAQQFVMDVVVAKGAERRRATARGRDIYHVTAPIIVEAVERLLAGDTRHAGGVHALGAIFDARSFLDALAAHSLEVSYGPMSQALLDRDIVGAS